MSSIKAVVGGLALDITTNSPVVILIPEGTKDDTKLPIWIGHYEAWAIGCEMSGVKSKRPLIHDLLVDIIKKMDAQVERVTVTELKEQTFYAVITLNQGGEICEIDARPSDSIAIALKAQAPIFVNETLFGDEKKSASGIPYAETLRERLRKINPEQFGDYKL